MTTAEQPRTLARTRRATASAWRRCCTRSPTRCGCGWCARWRRRHASCPVRTSQLPVTKSTSTHHFRVLRESGVIRQIYRGTAKMNALRRDDLDAALPRSARQRPRRGRPPGRRGDASGRRPRSGPAGG